MGLADEFDILLKVVEGRPTNPILRLVELFEKIVVKPKHHILAETQLYLPTVDVSNARVLIVLAVHDQELLPLLEQNYVGLRRVGHYKVFHDSTGYRKDMEPKLRALIVLRIIIAIANGCRNNVLKPKDFARLVVFTLNFTRTCNLSRTLATIRLYECQRPVDPPDDAMGTVLAFLKYPERLLVVGILQERGPPRETGVRCGHAIAATFGHRFVEQFLGLSKCQDLHGSLVDPDRSPFIRYLTL